MGIYRRARDAVKRSGGFRPQRFVFSLRPTCLEGIPRTVQQIVLEWKGSGSKLSFTKVQPVDSTGMAIFDETLTMTDKGFEEKHYILKAVDVQEIKSMGRVVDKTVCIAQYKLDFACFTRTIVQHAGAEEEIEVSLKGLDGSHILLRAFVKATLLKEWQPDLTSSNSEVSSMSLGGTVASLADDDYVIDDDEDEDSQDLHILVQTSSMSMHSDDSEGAPSTAQSPAKKHQDWGLETITEADYSMKCSASQEAQRAVYGQASGNGEWKDCMNSSGASVASRSPPGSSMGLPKSFGFIKNLMRNAKPAGDLKDLEPLELQMEMARRETVDIRAEEDICALRNHAVQLVYAKEVLKATNNELRQLLTEAQTQAHSDEAITQELVQAKLDVANAAYQRLQLESALQLEKNRNRNLSAKLTQMSVERDLLANRISCEKRRK